MAYTTAQLVAAYTNANLGKAPDAATTLAIDAYASGTTTGSYSDAQALTNTLKLVNSTTAVAVETYQFFTGRAPSAAGLSYLVNSTTNANDLNDTYYSKFAQENRFINFSINLATGAGEGAAAFAAAYTGVSYAQTVATAYDKIIGNSVAAAAGVDVAAAVAYLSRAENITYLTNFVKANTGLTAAADIDLAVKAALIGEILNAATVSGLGAYAGSTAALITDLSDGTLSTDAAGGVNILTAYPSAGATGTTYTLIPGADTITGTNGNDTINALTINASGAAANTLTAFDSIDGGAGVDTLNIYTSGTENTALPANVTVKNVEVVNILNSAAAAAFGDASKFQGAQQIWQVGAATGVTNLANGQTAGFRGLAAQNISVGTNSTATTAAIALDSFVDSTGVATPSKITVDGSADSALGTVTISGTVVDGADTGSGVSAVDLEFKIGKDVKTAVVSSAIAATLTVTDTASTDKVTAVNLSGSTGAITFVGDTDVATITGGAGKDTLTIATTTAKDDATTPSVNETVSAVLDAGAGNDVITIATTGAGTTTVTGGAGNDTVTHTSHGTGVLTVNLGDGNDSFKGAGVVTANDVIDGGAGTDTLLLSVVGVANIGAFSNFEVFDAAGLNKTLDVEILATKNTVTEFVASADTGGAAVLTNLGAGVGFRVTGDTTLANATTLTQKTAGALTVTLDIDESADGTTTSTATDATVVATNATSLKAVFDSSFAGVAASGTDNVANLALTGTAATSLSVVSGGANASNDLDYTTASASGKAVLTSATLTGASALNFDIVITGGGTAQASVDASGLTGALTFNTNDLKAESATNTFNGGTLTLGAGADVITVSQGASIASIQKGTVEDAASQTNFDVLVSTGAVQAADVAATATVTVKDGLLTFNGTGPATLAAAIGLADSDATSTAGQSVVFEYLGNSYVFIQGGVGADTVVKLVGTTGLHGIDTVAANSLYVF